MRKKLVFLLLPILMFGAVFSTAGCGNKPAGGEIKILVAGNLANNWEQQVAKDVLVKPFEKLCNCRVDFQVLDASGVEKKVKTEQDTGEIVNDIVMAHSGAMPYYYENGYLQDIAADVAFTDRTIDKEGLFKGVTHVGDKQFFMTISADVYLTIANKEALPYLPEGKDINNLSWEDFYQWSYNLKYGANGQASKGAMTMFPAQPGKNLIYILGSMGLAYGADFVEVNTPNMQQAYDVLSDMAKEDVFVGEQTNYATAVTKMKNGTALLSFQHMGPAGEIYKSAPDKFVYGAPPSGDAGKGSVVGSWGVGLLKKAPNKELAVKFFEYISRPDVNYKYCAALGGLISPVDEVVQELKSKPESLLEDSDKIMLIGIDIMETGIISDVPSADYKDWNAVKTCYESVFTEIMKKTDDYKNKLSNIANQLKALEKEKVS